MARTVIQIIASALAKQYNLSAADSSAFIDSFFAIISEELKKGNQVKIKSLGTFKVQRVKPRESVNVNTGERVFHCGIGSERNLIMSFNQDTFSCVHIDALTWFNTLNLEGS